MIGAPALSVIVPVLDEARAAPRLVSDLARQEGLSLELVAVDGGSRDGTPEVLASSARTTGFPLRLLTAPVGRAPQLNAGAQAARAPDLLFLHADSELSDPRLLRRAQAALAAERVRRGNDRVVGHFALEFLGPCDRAPLLQFLLEARSRLSRPGFVTGDQGFWLSRAYFDELGGFDETLPLFEDVRLARRAFRTGAWVRLPGALATSPRRFETEGLAPRLVLNALLRGCEAAGVTDLLRSGAAYRPQGQAGVDLPAACRAVHRELARLGVRRALEAFAQAGAYGASQAWQLPFLLACLGARRRRLTAEAVGSSWPPPAPRRPLPSGAAALLGACLFYGIWTVALCLAHRPGRADTQPGNPARYPLGSRGPEPARRPRRPSHPGEATCTPSKHGFEPPRS